MGCLFLHSKQYVLEMHQKFISGNLKKSLLSTYTFQYLPKADK